MASFAEFGRAIDRELEKLRQFIEKEVKPTTQRRTVEALRAASKRLAEVAREIETRGGAKPRTRKRKK